MRLLTFVMCFLLVRAGLAAAPAPEFQHPGVLLNRTQLDLIKQRVAAGTEPQKTAFAALLASPLADLAYAPSPRATVECGSYSKPDLGCKDERRDSAAAYSQAIAWCVTGNARYARNAIRIMNAWATTLTGGHTNSNGPIQAAWSASVWPRAAEIVRHTSDFWAPEDIARFEKMLVKQYVPSLDRRLRRKRQQGARDGRSAHRTSAFSTTTASLFADGVKHVARSHPRRTFTSRSDGPDAHRSRPSGLPSSALHGATRAQIRALRRRPPAGDPCPTILTTPT